MFASRSDRSGYSVQWHSVLRDSYSRGVASHLHSANAFIFGNRVIVMNA